MNYPIFDGHSDTPLKYFYRGIPTFGEHPAHVTLRGMGKLPRYAQFFAFCTVCYPCGLTPEELFRAGYGDFLRQLEIHGDKMTLCTSRGQMENAWEAGKCAAFLALEGAEAIGCDPGRLEEAYVMGVRMVSLTWNYDNPLSGTNVTGTGLTARGREFFRRAQSLGMLVDVSHISDKAFFELCELAEAPILASHSNSRALCPHPRNLTDDQFRCLRDLGGTAGLNLYAPFLHPEGRASWDDVHRHLEHFLSLNGEKTVALGGDLDGIAIAPEGFSGVEDYRSLFDHLERCGYAPSLLNALGAGNLTRALVHCAMRNEEFYVFGATDAKNCSFLIPNF